MSRDEFEKLCGQHANALFCFVLSRVPGRDSNKAVDVCQESWLKAWQKLAQFQSGSNFRAWLFGIAKNVLIDASRKKTMLPLMSDPALPAAQSSPLEAMLDGERKAAVAECIKALPPDEAAVVRMRGEGWSNQEIAEKIGATVNRVHTLFFQGKSKLKLCVERKLP